MGKSTKKETAEANVEVVKRAANVAFRGSITFRSTKDANGEPCRKVVIRNLTPDNGDEWIPFAKLIAIANEKDSIAIVAIKLREAYVAKGFGKLDAASRAFEKTIANCRICVSYSSHKKGDKYVNAKGEECTAENDGWHKTQNEYGDFDIRLRLTDAAKEAVAAENWKFFVKEEEEEDF